MPIRFKDSRVPGLSAVNRLPRLPLPPFLIDAFLRFGSFHQGPIDQTDLSRLELIGHADDELPNDGKTLQAFHSVASVSRLDLTTKSDTPYVNIPAIYESLGNWSGCIHIQDHLKRLPALLLPDFASHRGLREPSQGIGTELIQGFRTV